MPAADGEYNVKIPNKTKMISYNSKKANTEYTERSMVTGKLYKALAEDIQNTTIQQRKISTLSTTLGARTPVTVSCGVLICF